MLAAVKGTMREAWRLGQLDAEELRRIEDVPSVKAKTLPAGRAVLPAEIARLVGACDRSTAGGARDAALLAVLYGGGLRRAEAVALGLDDFNSETGALTIRGGKGGKDRIGYATNGAGALLAGWLVHRGQEPGPLFCPVRKDGRIEVRRMTAQAAYKALHVLAVDAGIRSFSPHDLRRSFVGALLDAGADLASVQALAGHASPTTTARYDRRGERARRAAAELLHVPVGE
jgi:integrase